MIFHIKKNYFFPLAVRDSSSLLESIVKIALGLLVETCSNMS